MPNIPKIITRFTTKSAITSEEHKYLEQKDMLSKHEGRGNRTDLRIDGIYECSLTRANTNTENIARLALDKNEAHQPIITLPFTLFRGIRLSKSNLNYMIESKSTLDFAVSEKSKHTHMSCYAPSSSKFSTMFSEKGMVAVVFVIPPHCVSIKKGWCNTGFHTFLLKEDKELKNISIEKIWEKDRVNYIQLSSLNNN